MGWDGHCAEKYEENLQQRLFEGLIIQWKTNLCPTLKMEVKTFQPARIITKTGLQKINKSSFLFTWLFPLCSLMMLIPSRISMILRASPHSSSPAAPRIDTLSCSLETADNLLAETSKSSRLLRGCSPTGRYSGRPPRERCSLPLEPVQGAPHLRTFGPASAVSLLRNKPSAEVSKENKGLVKYLGAGCRCSVIFWCLLSAVLRPAGRQDETEVRTRRGTDAARRQQQNAGHMVAIYRSFFLKK